MALNWFGKGSDVKRPEYDPKALYEGYVGDDIRRSSLASGVRSGFPRTEVEYNNALTALTHPVHGKPISVDHTSNTVTYISGKMTKECAEDEILNHHRNYLGRYTPGEIEILAPSTYMGMEASELRELENELDKNDMTLRELIEAMKS